MTSHPAEGAGAAVLSDDEVYRYRLERWWAAPVERWAVTWIMLNPSRADAERDDHTVRVCRAFSTAWGYNGMVVVNLFALRSSDPKALARHPDPVGPLNDDMLNSTVASAGLVICAWGVHGTLHNRGLVVADRLRATNALHCLGRTKGGQPKHPARLPLSLRPALFVATAGAS